MNESKLHTIYLPDRDSWRDWLSRNHKREKGVWLIYYKKHTGKPRVSYNDAVEEALCFGWIDSTVMRLDEERYKQKFTPRKPRSTWSESNKKRVKELIRAGKMTAAGMEVITAAKENCTWDAPLRSDLPDELSEPLMKQLREDNEAYAGYRQLTPGRRRNFIRWVMYAKREETREKRFREMVQLIKSGEELGMR
jgi:uncharacterized protein YdeI (YjbR/CyaY-like superfamily)